MTVILAAIAAFVAAVIQRITGLGFVLVLVGPIVLLYGPVEGVTLGVLLALVASLTAEQREKQRIVVKSSGRVFFVKVDDIDWIEAEGNYVRLHVGSTSHLIRSTLRGMAGQLDPSTFIRIHRSTISPAEVLSVAERLLGMSHDERAALPFMHPGRVDVIGAGALILACVVDAAAAGEVLVSEHDILDGIAWSLA